MDTLNLIISNIPRVMWAHMVNGFAGRGDAHITLTMEQQIELVSAKLLEFATGVAKGHAVNMAQIEAARTTSAQADALIAVTKQTVTMSVEPSAG